MRSVRGEPKGHGSMLRPLTIWLHATPVAIAEQRGERRAESGSDECTAGRAAAVRVRRVGSGADGR
jgi:hypothetical protein